MSNLYTDDVRAAYHLHKKPFRELEVHIVDYGPYLTLRIYQENFESFSDDKKALIVQWLSEVMTDLVQLVPIYLERI